MDLFEAQMGCDPQDLPLPERLRPKALDEIQGQSSSLRALGSWLKDPRRLPNMILWGPPGCGKTTVARIIGAQSGLEFVALNAVSTGAKEMRELGLRAHERKIQGLGSTLVFIDEIHRLNRSQQDVLLPFCESGDLILIGATTENPGYELNSALLSRARVLRLDPLKREDLEKVLSGAIESLSIRSTELFGDSLKDALISISDGDARRLLSHLERVHGWVREFNRPMTLADWTALDAHGPAVRYDKNKDEHYDTISAFIKSVRGSDADAAVYYLARMLEGGEDPVFIARRLVILASEDIGNADPRALPLAVAGLQAVELVGMPEAAINLSQVTTFLSSAPKSNAAYNAIKKAQATVKQTGTLPVPKALRSSQTRLAKEMGHGEGYRYAHDGPTGWQKMDFLPKELRDIKFYEPTDRGFERTIKEYLQWMKQTPK